MWNKRITEARERIGINKSEFARQVGVSTATTADWETGTIKMIDGENLVKAAEVLGVTPEWIMSGSQRMTLTEQRLARIWMRHATDHSWLDCSTEMSDIASVLVSTGADNDTVAMFLDACELALSVLIYEMQQRRAA